MDAPVRAEGLLRQWKGDSFAFGLDCLGETGILAARFGRKAVLVANKSAWLTDAV